MNDIVKREDNFDPTISDIENTQKICEKLMKTPHYAKMGAEGVFAITFKAKILGMHPFEALDGGLYYANGRVGMYAQTMNAMIRSKGHSIKQDVKSDDKICILIGRRADTGDTWKTSFSVDDAKRAGLMKNMYDKYPTTMLYNRAMSLMARQLFPDVIKGAGYTIEELKEIDKNKSVKLEELYDDVVEVVNIEKEEKKEEKKVEFVTEDQAKQLEALFAACDTSYTDKVWEGLSKKIPAIEKGKFHMIHADLFERLKLAAIKNKKEEIIDVKQQYAEASA